MRLFFIAIVIVLMAALTVYLLPRHKANSAQWKVEMLPYENCYASAVSSNGKIVALDCDGKPSIWRSGSPLKDVKGLASNSRGVIDWIANDGTCVGYYTLPGEDGTRAFRWDGKSIKKLAPFPKATSTMFRAPFDGGWVVNVSFGRVQRVYRVMGNRKEMLKSPDPRRPHTWANACSTDGKVVVGFAWDRKSNRLPVLWSKNGHPTALFDKMASRYGEGIAVSQNGKYIVYNDYDAIYLWSNNHAELVFKPAPPHVASANGVSRDGFPLVSLPPTDEFQVKAISPDGQVISGTRIQGDKNRSFTLVQWSRLHGLESLKVSLPETLDNTSTRWKPMASVISADGKIWCGQFHTGYRSRPMVLRRP